MGKATKTAEHIAHTLLKKIKALKAEHHVDEFVLPVIKKIYHKGVLFARGSVGCWRGASPTFKTGLTISVVLLVAVALVGCGSQRATRSGSATVHNVAATRPVSPSGKPGQAATGHPGPRASSPLNTRALTQQFPRLSNRLAAVSSPALINSSPQAQAQRIGLPASGSASLARHGSRLDVEIRVASIADTTARLRASGVEILHVSSQYRTITGTVVPEQLRAVSAVVGVEYVSEVLTPIMSGSQSVAPSVSKSPLDALTIAGSPLDALTIEESPLVRSSPGGALSTSILSGSTFSAGGLAAASTAASADRRCPTGSVVDEGDSVQQAASARQKYGIDGTGVKVGIISDSFNQAGSSAATNQWKDELSGDLPGFSNPCGYRTPVHIIDDSHGGSDEGRAMAQVVHHLAPGATLAFATYGGSQSWFADNIIRLATAGAKVIVDDVTLPDEPMFQDGPVAAAVSRVTAMGVTYYSAAGNDNLILNGHNAGSWETPSYRNMECPPVPLEEGKYLDDIFDNDYLNCLNFDPSGVSANANVGSSYMVRDKGAISISLQWAEPIGDVNTDLDAFLIDENNNIKGQATTDNITSKSPTETVSWFNKTGSDELVYLVVALKFSSGTDLPRVKYQLINPQGAIADAYYKQSSGSDIVGPTIFGHSGAADAISVAAEPYNDVDFILGTPTQIESFSSRGPVTHYFGPVNGTTPAARLFSPQVLLKPDLTAIDGAQTTFFNPTATAGLYRFYGTSSAAPHAAAVGALMLEKAPSATPSAVKNVSLSTATWLSGYDANAQGAGRVNALKAVEALVPVVSTDTAMGVGPSSAIVSGTVNPRGYDTWYKFEYGKTTLYGSNTLTTYAGNGSAAAVSETIKNLSSSTTYHYRIVALRSGKAVAYGADRTFTTLPVGTPTATTGSASSITFTTATLNGTVNPQGYATSYRFDYGTSTSYGKSTPPADAGSGTANVPARATVSGLTQTTVYHFRVVAMGNGNTVTYGPDQSFTTPASPRAVTTGAATNIDYASATLNGTINPKGYATNYRFDYGTSTSYGKSTPPADAGSGTANVPASAIITGLAASTTYHYRIVALNGGTAVTNGTDRTFVTKPSPVTTGAATNVGLYSATLKGTVNPQGIATSYRFDYGTSTSYGKSTSPADAGSGTANVPASAIISELSPRTTYHYRIVALRAGSAVAYGADQTFATQQLPGVTTGATTNVGLYSATLNGTVYPAGNPTSYRFDYGTSTSYGSSTKVTEAGAGTSTVWASATVNGLPAASTIYHYRIVALRAGTAVAYGADQTFTTTSPLQGGVFQQAKLTAADAAASNYLGNSMAISGSTMVVGSEKPYISNGPHKGAAYVFVWTGSAWTQQAKLTASDAATDDQFGYSVAIDGSTIVVGAKGVGTGVAYVFVRSGTKWTQQAKLTATDTTMYDNFGWSVAIDGSTIVVGNIGNNYYIGAAYVFVRSGTKWTQQAKLTASDAAKSDQFGMSVAIDGSTIVVGAGNQKSAAYVFVRSDTTWTQQATLTPADAVAWDDFGGSVAISGSTVVVGASRKNAAYVFVWTGSAWTQQAKLTAVDTAANDGFGSSVAISGSTIVVGATYANAGTGVAYVFVRSGTTWTQQAKLTSSDAATNDQLGSSVAIDGSTIVVGAEGKNSNTGATYVFVLPFQQAEFTAADTAAGDYFGGQVAIDGSTMVVGASNKDSFTGSVYVFVRSGTTWTQQAKLTPADAATNDNFGHSVAINGSTIVVGAMGKKWASGAAYVFVRSGTVWTQQATLTPANPKVYDEFGGSVAVDGSTVAVGAGGRNSSTGAAYVFVRSGTAWSLQAKLTAVDAATNDYFGGSVAISGSTVAVGAPRKNAAYVFVRSGTAWGQQAKLTAVDPTANDGFGYSVTTNGSVVVVGAFYGNAGTGAAYVFASSGAAWGQITAVDAATNDDFGGSVAISGSTVAVGAYGKNVGAGAAYIFTYGQLQPAPTNISLPTISGIPQQGQTLTESHGSWSNNPHYSYQWQNCDSSGNNCQAISGATSRTYTPQPADVGKTIRVLETASNANGSSTAASLPTAVVLPPAPVTKTPPTISGTAQQWKTLTESHGSWSNNPTDYSYQWQGCDSSGNNCQAISEATARTYMPQPADVGKTIRVLETASNANGSSTAASLPTAVVLPPAPVVDAGQVHTCGVETDGTVACWGNNGAFQATPPAGTFTQVSAGDWHTCGVKTDGTIACWGNNDYGQATPPTGTFTQVSTGGHHTCGLKSDGTIACWGAIDYGQSTPPTGTFTQVSAGGWHTCGVKTDGTIACWGSNTYATNFSGQATPPAGKFTQVSAGSWHTCGVKTDGTIACWGYNSLGPATPPSGTFTQVSAGLWHTCGVKTDGTIACWGDNDNAQATPPAGTFTQVSAGGWHTCGVKTNGTIACWGHSYNGQLGAAPSISNSPPARSVGTSYHFQFADGASPAASYKVVSGSLPDGLSLSLSGEISGTPTTVGTSTFEVRASNLLGSDTRSFSIE